MHQQPDPPQFKNSMGIHDAAGSRAMPCAHDQIELTTQPNNYRLIMAASTGNGLEIFDFTVYSFLPWSSANYISPAIPPTAHC